ncbi:cell division protein FtsA, partial [Treponema pallidum]
MGEVIVGLDIGTESIRAVVAERLEGGALQVVGVGVGHSKGLRRGVVVNIENTVVGIHHAVEAAEMMSGIEIAHCVVGLGGTHIEGRNLKGVVAVADKGKGHREVDQSDIDRVLEVACAVSLPPDRKILHVIPKVYSVDDQHGITDPRNIIGVRLEGEVHMITGSATCMRSVIDCVKRANLHIDFLMHNGLAAVRSVLNDDERNVGCVLINIGGGTTDVIAMYKGSPVLITSIPVGGSQVTSDLAKVKNLPLETAERIKIKDGCCWIPLLEGEGSVLISSQGNRIPVEISKREIAEIIEARMCEVFTIVRDRLSTVETQSGRGIIENIILCGGGAQLTGAVELASAIFDTPRVHLGIPSTLGGLAGEYRSPEFAVVLGLILEYTHKQGQRAY